MTEKPIHELTVFMKGAGEMATGIASRLHGANIFRILMAEVPVPLAVRRTVSFCEAVFDEEATVETIRAKRVSDSAEVRTAWAQGFIAVMVDPEWTMLQQNHFDVVIDATVAKNNLGTRIDDAPLVIGMGPGFTAGVDVHMVIETNRGHHLGRIIESGQAEANTGIPGDIAGYTKERVLRAPCGGCFTSETKIGDRVASGDLIGRVGTEPVTASIDGIVRGLIRPDSIVKEGLKIGDIDPRGAPEHCHTISDKARALGGAVLEAILRRCNTPGGSR